MKKYEIVPHTADVALRVFGQSKEELFKNALEGMAFLMKAEPAKEKVKREIEVLGSFDINSLLVDFLSEVIYWSKTEKEIYEKVAFKEFSENHLKAVIFGKKVKRFGEDIKGVTYNQLKIVKKNGIFQTLIIFDV